MFFCSAARHALGLPFTAPQKTALSNGDNLPALLYCPKAAKLCGRIGKEHGRPLFSPNRAKAGRRENKFFQNPTFAFMHNILLSYLGKPLHFFPSSCLFTVDNAKNAIEQHQNKQNSSRACGAENAILKPQKWGPPAVNLW